jgi:peptidyl-prolyl cis-trans isomerase SurA
MKNSLIKILLITSIIMLQSVIFAELKWLDKVSVIVEDDVILESEIQRRLKTVQSQLLAKDEKLPNEEALLKQVVERLIMDQLQLQEASRAGIRVSDVELNAALQTAAEANNATVILMKEQLESEGMNYELFRNDIRDEMLIARVRRGVVSRKVFVSEQEVDDILHIMEERGALNIEYHVRHLMLAVSETAAPEVVADVQAKIDKIIERFQAGEDFVELVVAESQGSDAISGGDLGWKKVEQLPTLFGNSVPSLDVGQLSTPIRSSNGMHLLMLEEKRGDTAKQMLSEVNYWHIQINVSAITSNEKAEAKLLAMKKIIEAETSSFEEQAKVNSEDLSTASEGGDLGWATKEAFKSLYGNNVEDLKEGVISQPFNTGTSWYIVKQMGTRITDQTDDVKRMQAKRLLQNRKYQEEEESWLREIREQAYVKMIKKKAE